MLRDDVIILTSMAFYDTQNFPWGFPRKHSHASRTRAIAVDLDRTWQYPLSEFRPKQTKAVWVNRVDLSLWAAMAVGMITSLTSTNCYLTRITNY